MGFCCKPLASAARSNSKAQCEGIEKGTRATLHVRLLDSNAVVTFEADYVIIADGKGAYTGAAPPPTGDFGIKAHFQEIVARETRSSCSAATGSTAAWPPSRAAAGTRRSACPPSGSNRIVATSQSFLRKSSGRIEFSASGCRGPEKLEIGWRLPCRDLR